MQPSLSESLAETSLMPPSGGELLVSPASSLSVVPWEIISGYSKFDRFACVTCIVCTVQTITIQ